MLDGRLAPSELIRALEKACPDHQIIGLCLGEDGLLQCFTSAERVDTLPGVPGELLAKLPHELGLPVQGCPAWHQRYGWEGKPLASLTLYGEGCMEAGPLAWLTLLALGMTSRIQLMAQAESAHARLTETILDTAVDAILTIDEHGLIQSFNRGAERHFGYTAAEVMGQNVKVLMPAPYREEHDGYLKAYRDTGHKKIIGIGRRVTGRRKDGSEFEAHLAVSEVASPGKRIFTGFIRDITDLVEAQAELVKQNLEHLRREERVKQKAIQDERQHLSRELHDSVSQALYGIGLGARAALGLLEKDPTRAGEPMAYVLSLAESGLSEMRALLFDLRPDSLQSEGLIAALRKHTKSLAQRYDLTLETELADEPLASVEIKHAAHRLTMEALHNVIKHAGATRVRLRLQCEGEWLLVEVEDDGGGFTPSEVPVGTLGLTSMRERLDELGGSFELVSAPGQGTRVCAHFPLM